MCKMVSCSEEALHPPVGGLALSGAELFAGTGASRLHWYRCMNRVCYRNKEYYYEER